MTRRSFVHIVCSPRPRVGKTLVARLLVDYFLAAGRPVVAFDSNPNEPTFADLFPNDITVADIRTVQGQVALFDRILVHDDTPKVVDLWHRVYDRFFNLVGEIGFIDEARRRSIEPLVYFLDDFDPLSDEAHSQLRDRFPGLMIVSVRNEGAGGSAVASRSWSGPVLSPFEPQLHIPPLDPILKRAIDGPGLSLSALLRAPPEDMSIVVKSAVRAWISKVFAQLQNFELRLSLSEAEFLR